MSRVYGLIIDETGTPGLHISLEAAKKQVEKEILKAWQETPDQLRFEWTTPIDANYETLDVYDVATDEFIDSLDYQVWEVVLWEDEENA